MLFCKAAGIVLVLGAVGYFSMNMGKCMEERKQELRKLYSLLVQLKSEIQYMCNTLPDCFSKLAKQTKSPFCDWLMELAERMEKKEDVLFQEIWKEELQYLYEISSLQ